MWETVEKPIPCWHLSRRQSSPLLRGCQGSRVLQGQGLGSLLLHSSGQEGSAPTCCGSIGQCVAGRKGNRISFEARIRECQQDASGCSAPLSLAVDSLGQRFVPSWGQEGTSIAPHAVGICIMAVAVMINEVFSFRGSFFYFCIITYV